MKDRYQYRILGQVDKDCLSILASQIQGGHYQPTCTVPFQWVSKVEGIGEGIGKVVL